MVDERSLFINMAAQCEKIHAVANKMLHVQIALASGGQPHHDVAVPGKAMQQHFEYGKQRGHETGAAACCSLLQPQDQLW